MPTRNTARIASIDVFRVFVACLRFRQAPAHACAARSARSSGADAGEVGIHVGVQPLGRVFVAPELLEVKGLQELLWALRGRLPSGRARRRGVDFGRAYLGVAQLRRIQLPERRTFSKMSPRPRAILAPGRGLERVRDPHPLHFPLNGAAEPSRASPPQRGATYEDE